VADVRVDILAARGSIDAWLRRTLVNVQLAVTAREPRRTDAPVVAYQVRALATVLTRLCDTQGNRSHQTLAPVARP